MMLMSGRIKLLPILKVNKTHNFRRKTERKKKRKKEREIITSGVANLCGREGGPHDNDNNNDHDNENDNSDYILTVFALCTHVIGEGS